MKPLKYHNLCNNFYLNWDEMIHQNVVNSWTSIDLPCKIKKISLVSPSYSLRGHFSLNFKEMFQQTWFQFCKNKIGVGSWRLWSIIIRERYQHISASTVVWTMNAALTREISINHITLLRNFIWKLTSKWKLMVLLTNILRKVEITHGSVHSFHS